MKVLNTADRLGCCLRMAKNRKSEPAGRLVEALKFTNGAVRLAWTQLCVEHNQGADMKIITLVRVLPHDDAPR